jgi:hypothetical protein
MTQYICSIDRATCIVMRNKRAVRLGYLQFAIFRTIHEARRAKRALVTGEELYDALYGGCKNPAGRNSIAVMCGQMNKKLKHLGLKMQGTNRRQNSFYQIVVLQ